MSPAFRNVLIFAFLLRLALALLFADLPTHYDESEFLGFGRAIAEEGAGPRLWRAPGYQYLLSSGLVLGGGKIVGARLLQVALSTLALFVLYRLGRRVGGERVGFWAATFLAFYPSHVAFSHLLWSETLYGLLVLAATERAVALMEQGRARDAAFAGALFGLAALTRSLGLVFLAAAVLAVVTWGRRDRAVWVRGAVMILFALAIVGPWSAYASRSAGRFVAIDTNAGFNLWSGNNEYIPADVQGVWSLGIDLENGLDERFQEFRPGDFWRRIVGMQMQEDGVDDPQGAAGDSWYRQQAAGFLRAHPGSLIARIPHKLAAFWAPDFFLPRHLLRDWYGATPPWVAALLTLATWLAACVPLILGPAALAALRASPLRRITLLALGSALVVHAIAYGHARMHQPFVPLLLLAVALVWFGERRSEERRRWWRGTPWAALALGLWVWGSPVVGGLYIAPGPRHVAFARVLAAGRGLPLPGARRLTWMLAEAEASAGDVAAAERILADGPHDQEPWSLFLRALLAERRGDRLLHLEKALRADPTLGPAQVLRRRLLSGEDGS